MAVQVKEVQVSRGRDKAGGIVRGAREFLVFDDGTGTAITSPHTVIDLYGTPTTPSELPAEGFVFPNIEELTAMDDFIAVEDEHPGMWRVRWEYGVSGGAGIGNPDDVGYVEYTLSGGSEFHEAWRNNPTAIPANGDPVPGAYADIGGEPVDSAGEPGTALRHQQIWEISEVIEGLTQFSFAFSKVGRRNSQPFMGGDVGEVLLLPLVVTRIGSNKFRRTFRFGWDEYFHMQQRPVRTVNNRVGLITSGTLSWAEGVYWYQPFSRPKVDFNTLSELW